MKTSGAPFGRMSHYFKEIQIRFSIHGLQGDVRLWHRSLPEHEAKSIVSLDERISLNDIGFDGDKRSATLWLEAVDAVPELNSKENVARNGRPDVVLKAELFRIGSECLATDCVKFLPVRPNSFLGDFVRPENRYLRNAITATLVNGEAEVHGTTTAVDPKESVTYGLQLVSEAELAKILEYSALNDGSTAYVHDVLFYHLPSLLDESPKGIRNLRPGLYRDMNTGLFREYSLA